MYYNGMPMLLSLGFMNQILVHLKKFFEVRNPSYYLSTSQKNTGRFLIIYQSMIFIVSDKFTFTILIRHQ